MRRTLVIHPRVITVAKVGASVTAAAMVVLVIVTLVLVLNALDTITRVQCSSHQTLERIITGTPQTRRDVFQRLGFDDTQIDAINAETARARQDQVRLLGPRPPGCTMPPPAPGTETTPATAAPAPARPPAVRFKGLPPIRFGAPAPPIPR